MLSSLIQVKTKLGISFKQRQELLMLAQSKEKKEEKELVDDSWIE